MNYTSYSESDASWEAMASPARGAKQIREDSDAGTLADQLQSALGECCDVDAGFFEEVWRRGVAAGIRDYRQRKVEARPIPDCTFASLNNLGSWSWMNAAPGTDQTTECLIPQEILTEYPVYREAFEGADAGSSDGGDAKRSERLCEETVEVLYPVTVDEARQLMNLTDQITGAEIKSAYRRLVKQWHPDHFEDANEREKRAAKERTVAINHAYRMLQSAVCGY